MTKYKMEEADAEAFLAWVKVCVCVCVCVCARARAFFVCVCAFFAWVKVHNLKTKGGGQYKKIVLLV
jgi:hypothetical protein